MGLKKGYVKKSLRATFRLILGGFVLFFVSSCSGPCSKYLTDQPIKKPKPHKKPAKPITVLQRRQYDICLLQRHGVQVIRMGQTWQLVFPSDDLFESDTADINPNYKSVLAVAADFMKTYSKIAVKVEGFSNHIPNEMVTKFGSYSLELTRLQAEEVARYLTDNNINARLIYSVGKGGLYPVAWGVTSQGHRLNRRLEITFRYYRDNTAWY